MTQCSHHILTRSERNIRGDGPLYLGPEGVQTDDCVPFYAIPKKLHSILNRTDLKRDLVLDPDRSHHYPQVLEYVVCENIRDETNSPVQNPYTHFLFQFSRFTLHSTLHGPRPPTSHFRCSKYYIKLPYPGPWSGGQSPAQSIVSSSKVPQNEQPYPEDYYRTRDRFH